jgi:hypothetical protein
MNGKIFKVEINPTPEERAKSYIESLERLNKTDLEQIKSYLGKSIRKAEGIIDRTKDLQIFVETALARKKAKK